MKHRLIKLAKFLLLGAIVNVAVAWVVNASTGLKWFITPSLDQPLAQHVKLWTDHAPDSFLKNPKFSGEYLFEAIGTSESIEVLIAHDPDMTNILCLRRAGWPVICVEGAMWCSWEWPLGKDDRTIYDAALPMPSWALSSTLYWRWLPLRPIWPGFAINTILYSLVLWMLWSSLCALRRILRHKPGHCIKCGYDLRETPNRCPECGWGREAEA